MVLRAAHRPGAVLLALALSAGCTDPVALQGPDVDSATDDGGVVQTTDGGGPLFSWGYTWGVASADFNDDGRTDLLVTTHRSWLYPEGVWLQRLDGSFHMAFRLSPLWKDRHGCAAADVNGDRLVDFYCQTGVSQGTEARPNELWIQQADGTFQDEAAAWGVADPHGRGRRPLFYDHDGDGRPDLYTTVWGERADEEVNRNRLWINRGVGFIERRTAATEHGVGSRCVDAGDFDSDGRTDLVVCGADLLLFRNRGLRHEDVSFLLGDPVRWPRDAVLADLDGDGLLDLVVVLHDAVEVRFNRGAGHRYASVDRRVELTEGDRATVTDVTGDGIPDLYVTEGCHDGRNWFDKLLTGPWYAEVGVAPHPVGGCGSIPVALGGRILVFAGGPDWPGPITWRGPG